MAAKPLQAVRPTDFVGEKIIEPRNLDQRGSTDHAAGPVVTFDRRKMSMSERFAEGRGYWRGVVTGGLLGLVLGSVASLALMEVWVPQIMSVAQQAWVASLVVSNRNDRATVEPLPNRSPSEPITPSAPPR